MTSQPHGSPSSAPQGEYTELRKVATHNLKAIDVQVPHRALTVVSGVSGSGKSSLAFDTLYAEGQRRFVESLSTYARQFLSRMERPPVELVRNIQPAVALRQKNSIKHARSTVGTLTEIVDLLQLIFTHIGVTTCPTCNTVVRRESPADVAETLEGLGLDRRLIFVADVQVLEIETPQTVLDGLVAEGYRRLWWEGAVKQVSDLDPEQLLERQAFPVVVDRQKTKEGNTLRLREAIEQGYALGRGALRVIDVTDRDTPVEHAFDRDFRCNTCSTPFIEPIPPLFSFNSPIGACPECSGFGKVTGLDMNKVVPNPNKSLEGGAVAVFESDSRKRQKSRMLKAAMARGIPIDLPLRKLKADDRDYILEGGPGYTGVRGFFNRKEDNKHKTSNRVLLARYRGYTTCPTCKGGRCSPEARCVTVEGRTIDQIWNMTVRDALAHFDGLELSPRDRARVEELIEEVRQRLRYLMDVGLGYLGLGRSSRTLSGGEVQRIHLTSSLGRMLTDTMYVLDEPTAGLHARDSLRLLSVLTRLRDIGNSVVVVEHDPDIIQGADWVVELGPEGGERGGQLLYEGTLGGLLRAETPTGDALRQRHLVGTLRGGDGDATRFDPERDPHFAVVEASSHNLDGITARFPCQRMTCVTGVSGSGKSTLVHYCLFQNWRRMQGQGGVEAGQIERLEGMGQFKDVILMAQGGLGRSSRSNVASYTKAWDGIRKLFGKLQEASRLGLSAGSFSFNTQGGRCEQCEGTGTLTVEMHFMADIEIVCDACDGRRFTDKVLSVRFREANIYDVLQMTVDDAVTFFEGTTRTIGRRLKPLQEVGLGYLRLGQTTSTLSGGEAQRLLLASYLGQGRKRAKADEQVLFVFDEPTIGLHLKDVEVLVRALRKVVAAGHTVVVVEHNTDFIAQADWVIDLGPDGGDGGGKIVVEGTPADVAQCPQSWTGRFLKEILA